MMTQLTRETSIAQTTPATQAQAQVPTQTNKSAFTRQIAGILLMATGIGWIGGNFVPTGMSNTVTAINEAIHFLPAFILLLFAVRLFQASAAHVPARGATIGITAVAVLVIVTCIVMGTLGIINPDPNSVGAHNLNDWTPVIISNAGTLLWLSSLIFKGRER